MAKTYLNDALKARAASQVKKESGEVTLDDISRVKVLSPGRQVFKRFIRNRLAVFGSVLLITMFVFSFIGPLFYAYGQKQIFYKYDEQNVNYAMAKENTAYNGFDVDSDVAVETRVKTAMNSNIKSMIEADEEERYLIGEDVAFKIEKLADDIYLLSRTETEEVAAYGKGKIKVGSYSMITKELTFAGAEVEGLKEAAATVKGKGGSVTVDGVNYTFTMSQPKTFDITMQLDGLRYTGEELGAAFESALKTAAELGVGFSVDGTEYALLKNGTLSTVYRVGEGTPAMVYTRLGVDTYEVGAKVSGEFRVGALLAATTGDGSFTADGKNFTASYEGENLVVRDADGNEFAEMTPFNVRRYTGEDSVAYDQKKHIANVVEEMSEKGQKTATFSYNLPQQNEDGSYVYDENNQLQYQEAEMVITQQNTGEYVIKADQIIYVIDRFGAPNWQHVLGTDGDGFDVLARIMYGGRVSLMVGFVVVFLECFLGIIMGGLAGYYGGWVDMVIMRLVDIFYCLPSMPIMIILGAMMDAQRLGTYTRLMIMMAALGIMGWAGVARLVRGQILSLREQEFMVATEATGVKVSRRIFRHLIPNVMPQLIVSATMGLGGVILTESTLSFLGLGIKRPMASWGTIINGVTSSNENMIKFTYIWIPVGLLICLTVIAFNFVGDGLRDAFDPKMKR